MSTEIAAVPTWAYQIKNVLAGLDSKEEEEEEEVQEDGNIYEFNDFSAQIPFTEEKKHLEYMNSLKVYEDHQKEASEEKKEEEEASKETHRDLFPEDADEEEQQQQDNSPSKRA